MIKKLAKHGNSHALILERPVLDLLNIDTEAPLEITTDGNVLIVSPVRDRKRVEKFQLALEKANKKFGKTLRGLG